MQLDRRVLPLQGGRNFRDFGGYETAGGARVKWGRLFRSGVMSGLTASDFDYLSSLGIKVVCDLRSASERAAEPTRWTVGDIQYLTFPDPSEDDNPLRAAFLDPDISAQRVSRLMPDLYAGLLEHLSPSYREIFAYLADGRLPFAVNCTAGKDRTGIAAALILVALEVPRQTVIADYALSDQLVDYFEAFKLNEAPPEPGPEDAPYANLRRLPRDLLVPLMRSDPAYLDTLFTRVEAEHGSVLAYIQSQLGVDDAALSRLRTHLLD